MSIGPFRVFTNEYTLKKIIRPRMNYKLKLNQIREVLGMEVKFERATLADGTIVEVEKLEVGFPVLIVAEDGSTKTAPVGEHILEDGTKIKVDDLGVIMEILPADEVETPEAEEVAAIPVAAAEIEIEVGEDEKEEETPIKDAVVSKIEENMKMLFEAITEVAGEVSTIKEEMGAMKTKMEKFSKAPAGAKIPKTTEVSKAVDTIEARVNALKALRSEFKK